MSHEAILSPTPIDPAEILRQFSAAAAGAGAVVSFTGLARGTTRDGRAVSALVLESHRSLTLRSMEAIAADAHARFAIAASRVIHREGRIAPGEAIVFVATAAPHRRAAFEAADYLMDRLKSEAVFWKREEGPDGARWIEPTADDAADLARWQNAGRTDHAGN
ncbi:MAG: molybdenum cofactor biosynthesis protein MoaE [Sphingomonadales bacterium]|nr:molybdenum cofactor biosynthesis protein MoaE [Sphingomonadales bacterium]